GFFFVGSTHEKLLTRGKDPQDNAVPSGNSMAAFGLLRLAGLCGNESYRSKAERTLSLCAGMMAAQPMAFGEMLAAVDFFLGPVRDYVVIGSAAEAAPALALIRGDFRPNRVVIRHEAGDAAAAKLLPQLAGKTGTRGQPTTYLCEGQTCE